jgi:catalase-peroxidase
VRIRLNPQKDWDVNQPKQPATLLQKLEAIQKEFNAAVTGGKKVSLADLIVLAGGAAIQKAAKDAASVIRPASGRPIGIEGNAAMGRTSTLTWLNTAV